MKTAKMMNVHFVHKDKALLRPLGTTKMTKMAGVTQAKPMFAKNPVFAFPPHLGTELAPQMWTTNVNKVRESTLISCEKL